MITTTLSWAANSPIKLRKMVIIEDAVAGGRIGLGPGLPHC
jgi:hypothetical protein